MASFRSRTAAKISAGDAAFVFVENDSTDETPSILRDWCATRPQASLHSYDRLAEFCRVRTIRLAKLRQQCLSVLRAEHPNATHFVIFDCDEVNAGLEGNLCRCTGYLPIVDAVLQAAEAGAAGDGPAPRGSKAHSGEAHR